MNPKQTPGQRFDPVLHPIDPDDLHVNDHPILTGLVPVVSNWIMAHPAISQAIVWLTPTKDQYYPAWSASQKEDLQQAFVKAWNREPSGLNPVPANLSPNTPDEYPATVMVPDEAWRFYVAGVGQSLALEIQQRLKWSLLSYSADDLAILLDSRECFMYDAYLKGYRIISNKNGDYTPAPPDLILAFLNGIQFLERVPSIRQWEPKRGSTNRLIRLAPSWQRNALVRLFDWCRRNLHHFAGGYTTADMQEHWQYHGYPPIARILSGTIKTGYSLVHWTAGCTGTVGFLTGVLRAVNIPVRHARVAQHSMPHFTHERAYLSHGDDLYGRYSIGKYSDAPLPYPSAELLISPTRFNEWFGPGVSSPDKNVARRSAELAVQHLPIGLIFDYCADKAAQASHADGLVFNYLSYYYSLAELEEANLWERLEAKLTALGGCAANPPTF